MLELAIVLIPVLYHLAGVLAKWLSDKLPISEEFAALALQEAVAYAARLLEQGSTEEEAVEYVKEAVPSSVAKFKKTDKQLGLMIKSRT